jgi:hypothetical protein
VLQTDARAIGRTQVSWRQTQRTPAGRSRAPHQSEQVTSGVWHEQAGLAQGRSSADAMALVSFPSREADGVGSSGLGV